VREAVRVKVNYVGFAKNLVGHGEEELSMPQATTVEALLSALAARHGDALYSSLVNGKTRLRSNVAIIVNGRGIEELGGLKTELPGDAEVSVVLGVYPLKGG
jgi:molybdopterin converting factor small subunit